MDIKFIDNSNLVLRDMKAAVERALTRCGMEAEGYAKDLSPFDTGLLRNSITYAISGKPPAQLTYKADKPAKDGKIKIGRYSGNAPDDTVKSVYIGTNVEYAVDQEIGTYKISPNPFLKPAVADHAQTYRNIIEDEMKNG